MKSLKTGLALSLAVAAFLVAGTAAKADPLTIDLTAPYQSGGGNVFAFYGTITNTSDQSVNLDGIDVNIGGVLTGDNSACYSNCPLTLGAGDSYTGLLFDIDVPTGATVGLYEGQFDITGDDGGIVGDANFDVNVTPEPASYLLLGTGLLGLGWAVRRRSKTGSRAQGLTAA